MTSHTVEIPPQEVLEAFLPTGFDSDAITRLDGGIVNTSFLAADLNGGKVVIQKLGVSSDPESAEDYAVVADHLAAKGWEMARPIEFSSGDFSYQDELDDLWRAYSFLESDGQVPDANVDNLREFAGMVGRLGLDLSDLEYQPRHSIPYFHDLGHIVSKLHAVTDQMVAADREFSEQLIDCLPNQDPFLAVSQIIHGDPKLSNALYRNGKPFTMIDWDTLMRGSPMLDLADMMRSITSNILDSSGATGVQDIMPVIEEYQAAAEIPERGRDKHIEESLICTKTMCLMLAMRYMTDVVDGNYFTWDPDKYPTHTKHNRARADRQWRNAVALNELLVAG